MEGSEKRIEKNFGLADAIAGQRERPAWPVWQQPSLAGGRDPIKPSHYTRHKIEPWDYVAANKLGYFEGSAIKYLTRWQYKNGVVDLKKARAFIDKLIAVEEKKSGETALGSPSLAPREPVPGDFATSDEYRSAYRAWSVRYAGEQVGGQPASEDAEHGADCGDGAK